MEKTADAQMPTVGSQSPTFEMVAKTLYGLEDVLADELRQLGAEDVTPGTRMVAFKGNMEILYRANFCCRTALRILKPIYTFKATDADELYEQAKLFDWDKFLSRQDFRYRLYGV